MADADTAAELQGCRQEKREGAAMLRKQEMAVWRPSGSRLLPCVLRSHRTRSMPLPMLSSKSSRKVEQFRSRGQERDERRRNSEEEPEQGRASQQVALPTPGGFIQGAPAICLELDLPLVGGVPGEGGSAGRSGTPILPHRHPILHPRIGALGKQSGQGPQYPRKKQPGRGPKDLGRK